MSTKFTEWTKRLGQQHFAMYDGTGRTLCGMPMLGNNYAHAMHDEDKAPCSQCAERMAFITEGELV
jgi:hypothetical protein|tara:strand:- start:294 stop:491 length:198 start_codon:yes stop_codon:yes gene_type:complete